MSSPATRFRSLRGIGLWFARNDQLVLSVLAIIIGVVVAYGAIGFLATIALLQEHSFANQARLRVDPRTRLFVRRRSAVVARRAGTDDRRLRDRVIPQIRNARRTSTGCGPSDRSGALRGGHIGLDRGLGAAAVSAATLGFGGSAGREGPMIHLGGAIASFVARRLHLNPQLSQTLLGCGVAAGIAASFNAPITGVIFALEVVIRHYALAAFSPIVIAAVAGTVISRTHTSATFPHSPFRRSPSARFGSFPPMSCWDFSPPDSPCCS